MALIRVTFANETRVALQLWWLDHSGVEQPYDLIEPSAHLARETFVDHVWIARVAVTGDESSGGSASASAGGGVVQGAQCGKFVARADGDMFVIDRAPRTSLAGFVLDEVLSVSVASKSCTLLGHFEDAPEGARTMLTLSQPPIETELIASLASAGTALDVILTNDIYSTYRAYPTSPRLHLAAAMVSPCTDEHIAKARASSAHVVCETAELYARVTLPYITSIPPERLAWVRNILDRRQEADTIIFDDCDPQTGFMLQPTLHWNRVAVKELRVVGIAHRSDIRSLRDLRAEHLPLLEAMRERGVAALCLAFGLAPDAIQCFIHYLPSYFHFHVHYVHAANDAASSRIGHAVPLESAIDCLRLVPDFYARCTLPILVAEAHPLWARFAASDGRP